MPRTRLPDRRLTITERVEFGTRVFLVSIGYARDGQVREIFVDGVKSGSDEEALLDAACILLSRLLQRGDRIGDIAASVGQASAIGVIALHAALSEVRDRAAIEEAYAAHERLMLNRSLAKEPA